MKKFLITIISLSFATHIVALEQQLRRLSGSLRTLEATLKPQGGPAIVLPQPSVWPEQVRLDQFKAKVTFTEQDIQMAQRDLEALVRIGASPAKTMEYRVLIENRLHDLGLVPAIPGEKPVQPTPVEEPLKITEKEEPAKPKVAERKLLIKGVTKMPKFLVAAAPMEISVPNGESMQAVIGILEENGNLVIWGPKLKVEPNFNMFFVTGKFMFPHFDAVQHTVVGPNIQVEYEIYPPVINMVELIAQKQAYMTNLKINVDQQISGINQAIKSGNLPDLLRIVQDTIPQIVGNIIAQLKAGPLQIEKLYPRMFDERVVAIGQIENLIGEVENATSRVIDRLLREFRSLLQVKQEVFARYISEGKPDVQPDFNLLTKRWNTDKGYAATRENLKLFTDASLALNTRLNQIIDWAHITEAQKKELMEILKTSLEEKAGLVRFSEPTGGSIKDRLQAQKQNNLLISVGEYYKNLQTTLKEVVSRQQKAQEAEAAGQAFQEQVAREAERQKRIQELAAEAERQRQAEIGGVSEEEWESND